MFDVWLNVMFGEAAIKEFYSEKKLQQPDNVGEGEHTKPSQGASDNQNLKQS